MKHAVNIMIEKEREREREWSKFSAVKEEGFG
jgi:hypothetical protein